MKPDSHSKTSPAAQGRFLLGGMLAGAAIGAALNLWTPPAVRDWILANLTEPLGGAFLRALMMLAAPLVFSTLVVGVARLGTIQKVGRMTGRLLVYYLCTTALAVLIGTALAVTFAPGAGLSEAHVEAALTAENGRVASLARQSLSTPESLWPGFLEKLIPASIPLATAEGNMLAVIFASLLFGFALASVEVSRSGPAVKVLSAVADSMVAVVGWLMRFAPLFLGLLTLNAAARFEAEQASPALGLAAVVIAGCALQFGAYVAFAHFALKVPAWKFLTQASPALGTAFSTASSNATMPTTIHTLETRFGVPPAVTTLSVPIGTTVNMDGTALYQAAAAVFVSQVFGIGLEWTDYLTLMVFVLISSIGISGVPGGSIPVLITAMGTIGIPPEGIALVLAVDRVLDMLRTAINVAGDLVGTLYLHKRVSDTFLMPAASEPVKPDLSAIPKPLATEIKPARRRPRVAEKKKAPAEG